MVPLNLVGVVDEGQLELRGVVFTESSGGSPLTLAKGLPPRDSVATTLRTSTCL